MNRDDHHKNQFIPGWAGRIPFEVIRRFKRLSMLVNPEEADIEVKAGKLKVIGVAAKETGLLLGRKNEADVGIFFVAVEIVARSPEESDHFADQAGLVERFLFDRGRDRLVGRFGFVG